MAPTQSKSPTVKESARTPKAAAAKAPAGTVPARSTKPASALRRKGVRVLGSDRADLQADLKAKYEAGASIRSLAHETGRSYGFVHKVLVESKAVLRARGGAHTQEPARAVSSGRKQAGGAER